VFFKKQIARPDSTKYIIIQLYILLTIRTKKLWYILRKFEKHPVLPQLGLKIEKQKRN
jgi:hypothetical protein